MRRAMTLSLLLAAITIATTGCLGRVTVHGHGGGVIQGGNTHVAVVFSDSDRRYIHDYYYASYRQKHKYKKGRALPPGLAKRKALPPGLAKRERLPPGLSRHPLPRELDARLSRLPAGVVRVRIGTKIVLMNEHTRMVLDVITDIPLD